MNLCHIVPSLALRHGGPSRSVFNLCRALGAAGHATDLLTTTTAEEGDPPAAVHPSFRIHGFPRGRPQRICPSGELRRWLGRAEVSLVHHHGLWLRTLHYAHRHAQRARIPLVLSPRGMMSRWAWRHHPWRKRLARALVHPGAFEAVSGWHATSTEEADEIRALGFNQPVCVAPNGVEATPAADQALARQFWQERCPATLTHRVALFHSRLHPKKRVLELIDGWLQGAPAGWLLLIVGIPQDYTPETLSRYVFRAGGTGRVAVYSGVDTPAPYAVASLFLLPSHNENFGLVIAEAMAHGVPVLVTDTTPWQAVRDRDLGWCVPWEDYGAALRAATAEPAERLRARGEAAQEWVLREFAWDRSARLLADFYPALAPVRA